MKKIILEVSNSDAQEIAKWIENHSMMLLCSTVPALHHWTINTDQIQIEE